VTSRKLLSTLILVTLALSVLSGLSGNTPVVTAGLYPAIYVDPPLVQNVMPPNTFTVSIKTDYMGDDITGWQFVLYYNPLVLHGVSIANGDLIVGGSATFMPGTIDNVIGKLSATAFFFFVFEPAPMTSGPGTLAHVTFEVVGLGDSPITLGMGIGETKLKGYTDGGYGDPYNIIDGFEDPDHLQHGQFQNLVVTHDIAVISVTPNDTEVIENDLVDISVEVKNQGTATETFDVSTYYDIFSLIGTKTGVILEGGASTTLTFTWDTTPVSAATHSIRAVASTVPGETNTANNELTSPQTVTVLPSIVAMIDAPEEGYLREAVIFYANDSYSARGTIVEYFWDFGDGTNETLTTPVVEHNFVKLGIYGVWLWVTDDLGERSDAAYHNIRIVERTVYAADLVKWKLKPEAHHWVESKDTDGKVTLTALAANLGNQPIKVTIAFAILDSRRGGLIPPVLVEELTLEVGKQVPVSVLIDPYEYGYTGTKIVLFAQATLTYDSDGDGTPDTEASTKLVSFAVVP